MKKVTGWKHTSHDRKGREALELDGPNCIQEHLGAATCGEEEEGEGALLVQEQVDMSVRPHSLIAAGV